MASKSRLEEVEDELGELERKCQRLANFLKSANNCMVYTGAGISTAASIPDYRGPQGVWTLAGQGREPAASCNPLHSEPTLTHMALRELNKRGYVRHILSQNCDGLHLRSGVPQPALSEVHGNMYIEVCTACDPQRQYIRGFDVTGATRFRRHNTERRCESCRAELRDTIVHFGEFGRLRWPLNWTAATDLLHRGPRDGCDLILCLGSSLQILNRYPFLWAQDRPKKDQPKLVIVNLQWTPKDRGATLKINGRCDFVMRKVMELLRLPVPQYCRFCDPVLGDRRRRRRGQELLKDLTECSCPAKPSSSSSSTSAPSSSSSSSSPATHSDDSLSGSRPGWWMAGLASIRKRDAVPARAGKAKRGRKVTPAPVSEDSDDDIPLAAFQAPCSSSQQNSEPESESKEETEDLKTEAQPPTSECKPEFSNGQAFSSKGEREGVAVMVETMVGTEVAPGPLSTCPPLELQAPAVDQIQMQRGDVGELKVEVKRGAEEENRTKLASPFAIHQLLS